MSEESEKDADSGNKNGWDVLYFFIEKVSSFLFRLLDKGKINSALIVFFVLIFLGFLLALVWKIPGEEVAPFLVQAVKFASSSYLSWLPLLVLSFFLVFVIVTQHINHKAETKRLGEERDRLQKEKGLSKHHSSNWSGD